MKTKSHSSRWPSRTRALRDWQLARLRCYLRDTVLPFSAHYGALFTRNRIEPSTLRTPGDLERIPFTAKTDFLAQTAGMPDPDLLIRTAGEMRVSNYLLWQISYAELFVSQVLWPDFGVEDLYQAMRSFAGRNRRFGALDHTNTLS